jgi:hypothetical protein
MSLNIEINKVARVLLTDGKWHRIEEDSFDLDAYEYCDGDELVFGGGQDKPLVPATGATWIEDFADHTFKRRVFCPVSAILAVSYDGEAVAPE